MGSTRHFSDGTACGIRECGDEFGGRPFPGSSLFDQTGDHRAQAFALDDFFRQPPDSSEVELEVTSWESGGSVTSVTRTFGGRWNLPYLGIGFIEGGEDLGEVGHAGESSLPCRPSTSAKDETQIHTHMCYAEFHRIVEGWRRSTPT
jgi:hypothetical protein